MISQYLMSIEGMEQVGVVLLIVCFVSFLYVIIHTIRADKRYVDRMSRLPLDADDHQPVTPEKVQQ